MPQHHAPQGLRNILRFYTQRRLLSIFLFGIASGFPWVMIGSSMSAWLNEAGMSRSAIGYFGAVYVMYSVNFLWSPLVDRIKIPALTQWLGQRRGWILFCQLGLAVTCFALSTINFEVHALTTAGLIALAVATFSATQDIAIDAYRIDSIGEHEGTVQSAAAAMATSGWWTGFAGIGSIPFFLSELPGWDWATIYKGLAFIMLLLTSGIWLAREPYTNRAERQFNAEQRYIAAAVSRPSLSFSLPLLGFTLFALLALAITRMEEASASQWALWGLCVLAAFALATRNLMALERHTNGSASAAHTPTSHTLIRSHHRISAWLIVTMIEPLAEFFRRNGVRFALSILLFVLLFKVGEAFLGRMSIVFYQEIGFSNAQIGVYSKLLNWWVTIFFSLVGSYVTMRAGIIKGLFIGGSAMALSNLFFAALALIGPSEPLLVAAVIVDGFTSAWSTVAFVALISLMTNRAFTASQYALMASIATLGRTLLGSYSGALVDWLNGNWALFFVITTVMVLPSLLFLWSIRKPIQDLEQAGKNKQRNTENGEQT
ncbi:MFS transporter permease [Aliidiomarina taiwanensis]|uniref:MFS transporter permease n=1 Tax=Aliidiomarina taiwanensis TaxID=946228 RepID=A0A432X221_9GAMM|nr:MFS transporter [Aliidiomarina taiwanensis]RUO40610.1 MFS transporter permease [Aliidiomarina taiwanensis]